MLLQDNNNQDRLLEQQLNEVNQELEDLATAKTQMASQGMGAGDYSYQTATQIVRKERVLKEAEAKAQAQTDTTRTMIGGEAAQQTGIAPPEAPGMANIEEYVSSTGLTRRRDMDIEQANVASRQGEAPQVRNPSEQRGYAESIQKGDVEGWEAGEIVDWDPQEISNFPEMQGYVDSFGMPKRVIQMTNKNQMAGDKPEQIIMPYPEKNEIKAGAPKLDDYAGYANKHHLYNTDLDLYNAGKPILGVPKE